MLKGSKGYTYIYTNQLPGRNINKETSGNITIPDTHGPMKLN